MLLFERILADIILTVKRNIYLYFLKELCFWRETVSYGFRAHTIVSQFVIIECLFRFWHKRERKSTHHEEAKLTRVHTNTCNTCNTHTSFTSHVQPVQIKPLTWSLGRDSSITPINTTSDKLIKCQCRLTRDLRQTLGDIRLQVWRFIQVQVYTTNS